MPRHAGSKAGHTPQPLSPMLIFTKNAIYAVKHQDTFLVANHPHISI